MRLQKVKLQTTDLEAVTAFYQKLGFDVKKSSDEVLISIGTSILAFERSNTDEQPFYHFAFNIPENQLEAAKEWLIQYVELVTYKDKTTIDFPNWNAHAVYFYDAAGNMAELIARHDLRNSSELPFSAASITNICEIGIVSEQLQTLGQLIQHQTGLDVYKAASNVFIPLGSEESLLICVPKDRIWFLTDIAAKLFPIEVTFEKTTPNFDFEYEKYRFKSA